MPKFFIKDKQIYNDRIDIQGEDINHIKNVLRMKINDEILVANEDNGMNYKAKIASFERDKIICLIQEEFKGNVESNVKISLYQGFPKFDKFEYIIQKCTEVGVNEFIPVKMKRTIVKFNEKDLDKKLERFNKIAEIASKQSLRDIVPQVKNVIDYKNLVEEFKSYDLVLVAYEEEKDNTLKNVLREFEQKNKNEEYKIAILIGPEGGIDKDEIDQIKSLENVKVVTLGSRILRTETAPIVISSQVIYELEK